MTDAHTLATVVFFSGTFLVLTGLLKKFSERILFPYTVLLLIVGGLAQFFTTFYQIETHLSLSTDIIYFALLPLLLFESAMQINGHQFKLQFKTITFISTFGLLLSVFSVAVLMTLFIGVPLQIALLFGALISATDPIAVLALFKSLGAPKRLGLLAEGESMFNDATAVIIFRVISGFVLVESQFQTFTLAVSILNFLYVFVGSLIVGAILGFIFAQFIARVENDRLVEITLTMALAFVSFVGAEIFFHLSGVISTVAAGVILGNVGRTKISGNVVEFMHEWWEYVGFLSVSLVFFFAAFSLDFHSLLTEPKTTLLVILAVILGRAVSVYGSFLISNTWGIFKDEPNVPLKWQHVLNWGGLRGVIPLVLVYSLPEDFIYRDQFLVFTLSTFLFTLFVNATTIGWLLKKLGLHMPNKEELIIQEEVNLFALEEAKKRLENLPENEFDSNVVKQVQANFVQQEQDLKVRLLRLATPLDLEKSLRLESIQVERETIKRLFRQGHISENVVFDFESELDLQQDALEYPEVSRGRGYKIGGLLDSQGNFRERLRKLRENIQHYPFLQFVFRATKEHLVMQRFALLQARIVASSDVITHLEHVQELMKHNHRAVQVIKDVKSEHEQYRLKNSLQMQVLERDYQRWYQQFETKMIESFAWNQTEVRHTTH